MQNAAQNNRNKSPHTFEHTNGIMGKFIESHVLLRHHNSKRTQYGHCSIAYNRFRCDMVCEKIITIPCIFK